MRRILIVASALSALLSSGSARAVELEVAHWWTTQAESAAVARIAEAWTATGNTWNDAALAGGDATGLMVSRIVGGDPMDVFQFSPGPAAQELVDAGLLLDITDVAEAEGWRDVIVPSSLLDSCTFEGRVFCVPINIHSWQWMWVSRRAYEEAGLPVPTSWAEFVDTADELAAAGKVPLAMGAEPWQRSGAFGVLAVALAGEEAWLAVYRHRDEAVAAGPIFARAFEAAAQARELAAGTHVTDWNLATQMVIEGRAGAQIMGDWAQAEFALAGQVAGEDYSCLPGLGLGEAAVLGSGGDAFYFPLQDDPEVTAAQKQFAALVLSPEVQVAFNLAKGSLPVRGDVDLDAANDCMRKGLEALAAGRMIPADTELLDPDTLQQIDDLMAEFWGGPDLSATEAQARFAVIIAQSH
jgi:glucose/mannose transport system substrate-binding protein